MLHFKGNVSGNTQGVKVLILLHVMRLRGHNLFPHPNAGVVYFNVALSEYMLHLNLVLVSNSFQPEIFQTTQKTIPIAKALHHHPFTRTRRRHGLFGLKGRKNPADTFK